MSASILRTKAIFIKELQDIKSNMNILFMYLIPIAMTVIYKNFIPDMPEGFILGFGLLFLVTMAGMYVPAMMIAEEKEKKTLGVLMLSPARPMEVFAGKGLLTLLSILVTMFILLLVSGNGFRHIEIILTGVILTSIFGILLGMVIGILVQNQMATGIIGTPIYMILMLVPMLAQMGDGILKTIAKFLPTHYFFDMMAGVFDRNQGLADFGLHVAVLVSSIVVALLLLIYLYRRKGLE